MTETIFLTTIPLPSLITYAIAFLVLLLGSITDFKTREVPDFLNYGLIFTGVAVNLIFSFVYKNPGFIFGSLLGLGIFFSVAWIMFYTGQWGGGDSKLLMGLGALFGIPLTLSLEHHFLFSFFVNVLFAGAFYGVLWTIYLSLKHYKKFRKEYKAITYHRLHMVIRIILLTFLVLMGVFSYFVSFPPMRVYYFYLGVIPILIYYLWVMVKSVERSSMLVYLPPNKLTEGDWIAKDVFYKRKRICGPKDLGIEKKQIATLRKLHSQGKIKKVLVKQGIPFVPSFLIAFFLTLMWGNPLLYFLNLV